MSKTKQSALAPKLRFGEFEGEWRTSKIGKLCKCIVPGRNKPKIFEGEIPWITTPDINHQGVITQSKTGLGVSKEEAKNVGSKIVPQNSVVISCVGDLGLVAITGNKLVINQQLHAFLPCEELASRFTLYGLSTQVKFMDMVATKTAVPYMNKQNCNSIPIHYPTLPEQEKIAAFLTSMDDRIEQLKRKKSLLQDYKKGVMSRLFAVSNSECGIVNGECQQSTEKTHNSILTTQHSILRFKDNNDNPYPDWQEKKLGDVLTIGSGKDYKHLDKGSIPVYGSGGIMTHVNQQLYDGESVCIGRKGTIDKPRFLTGAFWTVDTLFYTHSFTCCLPKFIFYTFQQINWYKYNEASGVPSLSKGTIEKIKVQIPSTPEQTKIANYLSNLDTKINQVTQQITQTKTFKKGLLQQMFV